MIELTAAMEVTCWEAAGAPAKLPSRAQTMVSAALKAWVDLIARARLTFRYTENGPVGLLEGKKAYLVVASGGVGIDSEVDFATPYMRQALAFVGIDDVEVIAADRQNMRGDEALSEARARIAEVVHTEPQIKPSPRAA